MHLSGMHDVVNSQVRIAPTLREMETDSVINWGLRKMVESQ